MPKIIIIDDEDSFEPEDEQGDWKQVADVFPSALRQQLLGISLGE